MRGEKMKEGAPGRTYALTLLGVAVVSAGIALLLYAFNLAHDTELAERGHPLLDPRR